jgi:hypothetical protein
MSSRRADTGSASANVIGGMGFASVAFGRGVERARGADVIGPSCKIEHYFKAPR